MRIALALVALLLPGVLQAQVAIPRYQGELSADEKRYVSGMNYRPHDVPMRWLATGELLVLHQELYGSADVAFGRCGGSGVYSVSTRGSGAARAIATGTPICASTESMDGATVDPGGETLLYPVRTLPNNSRIVRLRLRDGTVDTLATVCAIYHEFARYSTDGSRIATHGLCRSRDHEYEVYVIKSDGTFLHRVGPADDVSHMDPTWSPDGRHLAYVRDGQRAPREGRGIFVTDSAGLDARRIAMGSHPAWNPTNDLIAFVAEQDGTGMRRTIKVVRADGSGSRIVFRNTVTSTFSRGWGPMPEGEPLGPLVWSPDGRQLAFARAFDAGANIWIIDLATGKARQLTKPAP